MHHRAVVPGGECTGTARLINDIVIGEETDVDPDGSYASHLDLYRHAMAEIGASTRQFDRFCSLVQVGVPVEVALARIGAPPHVQTFVTHTMALANSGSTEEVLAAFFYGREDIIPEMFQRLLSRLDDTRRRNDRLRHFIYYIERHIELDGDSHGPKGHELGRRAGGERAGSAAAGRARRVPQHQRQDRALERHIEQAPHQPRPSGAQSKPTGAGEIGFTIVSISLSLVAVFIPQFLMGGIVGCLFREFGITVSVTILVSMLVSLTLTPMMCSRFMRSKHQARHGRLYMLSERGFDLLLAGYRKSLNVALRHRRTTFAVFVATLVATGYLFAVIPKGFFPQQDTGLIFGTSETAQDISFPDAVRRQRALAEIVGKDPAVATVGMSLGANGTQTQNNGRFFITLRPRDQRDVSADQVIRRLRPQLAKVEGAALFLQVAQDINVGGRLARTQYQYTLQDPNLDELNQWSSKIFAKLKTLPELRDVATDQQTGGTTYTLTIDRDQAARFGIQPQLIDDTLYDAFGQRQVTQYFTQLNSYHVVLEVLPALQHPTEALSSIYVNSPSTGGQVPLSTFVKWTNEPTNFPVDQSPEHVPVSDPVVQPGIRYRVGAGHDSDPKCRSAARCAGDLDRQFPGNAQAFQASLASEPYLVAAAIVVIYIILGVLYESYVHPLTILSTLPSAGLGALATLMVFGFDFSLIALIGIILLIGIVKKNGIMLVDFAIEVQRNRGLGPVAAIREACLLRFRPIMMTTMAALLGGIPLTLGTGTGAEIRQPLGYAIVGGLIVSQALTLYTTPVVFLYLDRFNMWFTGASRRKATRITADVPLRQIPPAAASNVAD